MYTNERHKLGKEATERHASRSVFQATTGIRNYLVGLLIIKVNIFLKQGIKPDLGKGWGVGGVNSLLL